MKPIFDTLTEIAARHLNIPTLKERRSDSLDFEIERLRSVAARLLAALEGALYALDENGDGFGPSKRTALADARAAVSQAMEAGLAPSEPTAPPIVAVRVSGGLIDDVTATATVDVVVEDWDVAGDDTGKKPYSVLLLYPDRANDDGTETYYAFVEAADPIAAVAQAQRRALETNEWDDADPDAFAPLLVIEGQHCHRPY